MEEQVNNSVIRKLPDVLVDQIAAGEVVERPASVVKELVENSLDAGAMNIEVRINRGGKKEISVKDDGSGMNEDDLLLSIQRFATSKINNINDLEKISSYGFRGEALPSIASVSRMKISSSAEEGMGWEIEVSAGVKKNQNRKALGRGTFIQVKDLFFNIPARAKFLKTDATEKRRIINWIESMALLYFDRTFKVYTDDKLVFETFSRKKSRDRLIEVFGTDLSEQLIFCEKSTDNVSITGWLSKPTLTRRDRSQIRIFVNKRLVQSPQIISSLIKFYRDKIPHGSFPVVVLFFDIKPELLDVNVHPAKLEVRFLNEKELIGTLFRTIAESLTSSVKTLISSPESSSNGFNFEKISSITASSEIKEKTYLLEDNVNKSESLNISEPELIKENYNFKIIGQAGLRYIIVENSEGLILIDQHAAHERILYERFTAESKSADIQMQKLLLPVTLDLSRDDLLFLDDYLPSLKKIGFDIELFGDFSIIISAIPAYFSNNNIAELIISLIGTLKNEADAPGLEKIIRASCRQAVKFGDSLNKSEIQKLIYDLLNCSSPFTCPHGRPLSFKMSYDEINRKLGRI